MIKNRKLAETLNIKSRLLELNRSKKNSPTLFTWLSYLTKAFSLLLVVPLMLSHFPVQNIALWYLFISAINFQVLADLGFSSTLIRMFSYARGGLTINELSVVSKKKPENNETEYNWQTIQKVWQVMNFIYIRLGLSFVLFIILSSYFLYNPILRSADPTRSLIAWGFIIFTSFIQLRYSTFSNYLQGMNQVALVKKWETLFNLLAIVSNCLVLYFGGDILILVISNQCWAMVNTLRDVFLSRSIADGRYKSIDTKAEKNITVFNSIWPSVWKSGIGTLTSFGLFYVVNMIVSKNGNSKEIASYLLGYNLIRQISVFSQAPFYSKIPTFAQLRAQGNMVSFTKAIKRGMDISYWAYVVPVIAVGILGTYGLKYIHSHAAFPAALLWASLGFGILLERCGAMHIQIYSTSNKIIWHIANGVTGILILIFCIILIPLIGVYTIPTAIILGNLSFYTGYCMYHSYKEFEFNFFKFEGKGFIPSFIIMLTYLIYALIRN